MKPNKIATLDKSSIDRKNILNNPFVVEYIQRDLNIKGFIFEDQYRYTIEQAANFYEVDLKTIRRYISKNYTELEENGYEVLTGDRLSSFKKQFGVDIHVPTKTTILGLLTFKTFLNLGMLLKESEKAKVLRGVLLDIVINIVNQKAGGNTKFINQRDEDFLITLYLSQDYRKEFIESLRKYVDMGTTKYPFYTDKVYDSIFKEKAREYKKILNLNKRDNVRDTFYSEVLTTIATYETGLAHRIKKLSNELKRKLTSNEIDKIFNEFENDPVLIPQLDIARRKMSSLDYGLRYITHPELKDYIQPLNAIDFDKFLGKKSKDLAKQIEEHKNVFKRLKNK